MSSEEILNNTFLDEMCPDYTEDENWWIQFCDFWLDGVTKSCVAIWGMLTNVITCFILTRPSMKNSFNMSLAALAVIDTVYLVFEVLKTFYIRFNLVLGNYLMLMYPNVLYPMVGITLTSSIFMVVVITYERYSAVYYHVDYRNMSNDITMMKRRLLKYLFGVILLSIFLNFTKFFEAYVQLQGDHYEIKLSWLRRNLIYSQFTNWSRFLVIGILPLCIIMFLYLKVYQRLQERKRAVYVRPPTTIINESGGEMVPMGSIDEETVRINPLILNQDRRQREDHHAIIFMGIVIAFIICHSLRVFLDIHEIFTLKKSNFCQKNRPSVPSVPSWVFIIGNLSHVLLSLNANINAYIYGFMSSKFRLEIKKIFKDISRSCRSSSSNTNTLPQDNSTPV